MGNNKQFDNILNDCLERLITGQETVEQCLQRYPEYVKELAPLLRTATIMNKAVDVKPSEEFRARARYQMQLKMAESKAPPTYYSRCAALGHRGLYLNVSFCAWRRYSIGICRQYAGNPLYAVKLAAENVQVKLAWSQDKKAELYVAMANERVTK